ncbi:MAG: hypothetical protein U1E14_01165 [Geminicoccaceae bacterium]
MTGEQAIVFSILGVALVLFVWERLRYDLVALLALLASVILGVVPADEAFSGFADPPSSPWPRSSSSAGPSATRA